MVNDVINQIYPQSGGNLTPSSIDRSKKLQYWRKCKGCELHSQENNWIVLGPTMSPMTAMEFAEYQNSKHATPLPQYGQYIVGKHPNQKYDVTVPGERFRYIIEQDGINEFPIDQMIAYNWHRYEALQKIYPELKAVVDIPCEHGCVNRKFTSQEQYNSHISVMHKDVAQPEAIGRQFRAAIETMNSNGKTDIAAIVAAVMAAMSEQNKVK